MSTNIPFARKDTSLSPQAPSGSSSRGHKHKMAFLLSDPNNSKNHCLATQAAKKKRFSNPKPAPNDVEHHLGPK